MNPTQSQLAELAARSRGATPQKRVSQALILWVSCKKEIAVRGLAESPSISELAALCLDLHPPSNSPADAMEIWIEAGKSTTASRITATLHEERRGRKAELAGSLGLDVDMTLEKWLAKVLPKPRPAARGERLRQFLRVRSGTHEGEIVDLGAARAEFAKNVATWNGAIQEAERFLAWHHTETQKSKSERARKGGIGRQAKKKSAQIKKSQR